MDGVYFFKARFYDSKIGRFLQADTYVPESQGVLAFDRYAYSNNNPIRYSDPSGHNAWDVVGQFATGFVMEFARTTAWYSPHAQNALAVNVAESDAVLAGRVTADVVNIVVGVAEVADSLVNGAVTAFSGSRTAGQVVGNVTYNLVKNYGSSYYQNQGLNFIDCVDEGGACAK